MADEIKKKYPQIHVFELENSKPLEETEKEIQ